MRSIPRAVGLAALVAALMPRTAAAQATRPLTPRDVMRSEGLIPSGLTPDGQALLYLRLPRFGHPMPKLFLADLVGGTERELTKEIDPRARIMTAAWSPSGRRLVAAGTIGPETRVWAGDRDSDRLEQVKHQPLRTSSPPVLAWASEDALILATIPDEAIGSVVQAEDLTARQWAKTNEGREPSRSILDSGAKAEPSPGRLGSWTFLDLRDGSTKAVPGHGIPTRTVAAPDGRSVAGLYRISPPRVDLPGLLLDAAFSLDGLGLEVATVGRGELIVRRVEGAVDVQASTLLWSPDGSKLAFVGRRAGGGPELRAFVFEPRSGTLAEMSVEGRAGPWVPVQFAWSGRGRLLALKAASQADRLPGRPNWWAIRADAPPTNLTAELAADSMEMPSPLVAGPAGTLLGVVGAVLWRLDPDGGPAKNLSERSDLREVRLEWPPDSRAVDQVLISAKRGDGRVFGRYSPGDDEFTEIPRPSADALLRDFQPATGASVFTVANQLASGRESSLWACPGARQAPRRVAEANAHLRDVAAAALEAIHYEDADGRKLHGWLALPPGFARDRRWPMVAYVYPGQVFSDGAKPQIEEDVELLAGRGYVVLLPSMPRFPSDPHGALAKQVMPAVDKAIELGIADPGRLGLMGHSFGGYAVYGLVTQTNRFRAAVASAGLTDLVSVYGQFHPRLVRSNFPLDDTHHLNWAEIGQLGLGVPLWKDPALYARNSPIHHVGRVETPLLMLHGDQDFVPIQQAEEFYTSLARRGKRARFVRYWGEGHMIFMSPANYADYWREVFEWFGEL